MEKKKCEFQVEMILKIVQGMVDSSVELTHWLEFVMVMEEMILLEELILLLLMKFVQKDLMLNLGEYLYRFEDESIEQHDFLHFLQEGRKFV